MRRIKIWQYYFLQQFILQLRLYILFLSIIKVDVLKAGILQTILGVLSIIALIWGWRILKKADI